MAGHKAITAKPISLGTRLVSHSESDRDRRLLERRVKQIARLPSRDRGEAIRLVLRKMGANRPPELTVAYVERLLAFHR